MIVVAGRLEEVRAVAFRYLPIELTGINADDRAAELNLGSFRKISAEIRAKVNVEFQQWIINHIVARLGNARPINRAHSIYW